MSVDLPPPPATLAEAMRQANDLAYGFAKHVDPAYWQTGVGFQGDPAYYWKRMLGWQLTEESPDRALYGLYAFPPSPWRVPVVSLPAPPINPPLPDPPSAPPDETAAGVLALVLARLDAIDARLTTLEARRFTFPTYTTTVHAPWPIGTQTITLTPVVPT